MALIEQTLADLVQRLPHCKFPPRRRHATQHETHREQSRIYTKLHHQDCGTQPFYLWVKKIQHSFSLLRVGEKSTTLKSTADVLGRLSHDAHIHHSADSVSKSAARYFSRCEGTERHSQLPQVLRALRNREGASVTRNS